MRTKVYEAYFRTDQKQTAIKLNASDENDLENQAYKYAHRQGWEMTGYTFISDLASQEAA